MTRPPESRNALSRRQRERAARVLSVLAVRSRRLMPDVGSPGRFEVRVPGDRAPRLVADAGLVEAMHVQDWLTRCDDGLAATAAGLSWLRRRHAGEDGYRRQHLAAETVDIEAPNGARETVTVVANESPLAWLRRRTDRDGTPLISQTQYAAGERLRADFERGRLAPHVTADWTQAPAGRQRRGPGGACDLTDAALAARQRVDRALDALGPDLGSLLVDVCCFLAGLEDAERRRAWPRRSAKVVLGIALDRLAAHYGLSEAAQAPSRAQGLRHWGDADYRPVVE